MDKELALILAELLIKQDDTTSQVKEINLRLDETNARLGQTIERLDETNSILREFMGVSVKQWEQQQIFNEIISKDIRSIKETVSTAVQLETRIKAVEEREANLETRLSRVEKLLKAS